MEILKTENYDAFKSITSNREVSRGHVAKLVDSITTKNLLYLNPIIVDEDMNVIDGQHRLEACKQLSIPIHYVISGTIKKEDLKNLNSVQKSWTTMDYINYFTVEGKAEYRKFSNLMNQFPKIKISSMLELVTSDWNKEVKSGFLKIDRLDTAIEICKKIEYLASLEIYPFIYDAGFIRAFKRSLTLEAFSWDYFTEKLKRCPRKFMKCHSEKEYLQMMEELYNYELSKNRVLLTRGK